MSQPSNTVVFSRSEIIAKVKENLSTPELLDILEFKKIRIISILPGEVILVEGRPYDNLRVQIKRDNESLQMFYLKIFEITSEEGPTTQ